MNHSLLFRLWTPSLMPGLAFTGQGAPGLMTGGSITWGQLCREGCYSRSMTCEEKQVLVKQSHSGLIAHSSTGFHPDANNLLLGLPGSWD